MSEMRRFVEVTTEGVNFSEVSAGVDVTSPGPSQVIEVSHLEDEQWAQIKDDIKTGEVNSDNVISKLTSEDDSAI